MAAVPNLPGTRNWFRGRQSFHGRGWGVWVCGGMAQAVMRATGSHGGRQMKLHSPAAHLLLDGPVPNRLQTSIGPWPRGWGPLLYGPSLLH